MAWIGRHVGSSLLWPHGQSKLLSKIASKNREKHTHVASKDETGIYAKVSNI